MADPLPAPSPTAASDRRRVTPEWARKAAKWVPRS